MAQKYIYITVRSKKKKMDYRGCLPVCSSLFGVRLSLAIQEL